MLVVHVDIVAIYGSRASEATKKPKGSYCQAWPTPRQVIVMDHTSGLLTGPRGRAKRFCCLALAGRSVGLPWPCTLVDSGDLV